MAKQIPRASELPKPVLYALNWLREYTDAAVAAGGGGGGGVTAHSALTGLTIGDDHTQYHNDLRGDARYLQKANNLSDLVNAGTARSSLGLGTSAVLNVPAAGDAAAGEVVKGSDTRLTNARTPSVHATTHSSGGSDPISHNNLAGLTTGDPHTQYQLVSAKNAANGYAGLDASTKLTAAQLPAVTNAMLSTVSTATFKGRITAGVGAPEDLTATQATSLLDVFTTALKGLVPSGGSASTFLRGDGTWQTIAGGGDMLKANNLSDVLSVATARTNLGLGALATLVPPGTTTTYLRGDSTFQTLPLAGIISNASVADQTGFATDTYVTNSNVNVGGRVKAGTTIRWKIGLTKTAAGTAVPVFTVRAGTAGTIADTSRFAFNMATQTAATDSMIIDCELTIRSLSATGTASLSMRATHKNPPTGTNVSTGFQNVAQEQVFISTSSSFDTTGATLHFGISLNGGASAAWTVTTCEVQAYNLN